MVCLNCIQNITPLEINTTILDNATTELIPTLAATANSASGGYWALGVSIAFFLFLIVILFRQDKDIRMDIARTLLLSSGLTVILNILLLVTSFSTSVQPLLWFFAVFVFSALAIYNLKSNNLV